MQHDIVNSIKNYDSRLSTCSTPPILSLFHPLLSSSLALISFFSLALSFLLVPFVRYPHAFATLVCLTYTHNDADISVLVRGRCVPSLVPLRIEVSEGRRRWRYWEKRVEKKRERKSSACRRPSRSTRPGVTFIHFTCVVTFQTSMGPASGRCYETRETEIGNALWILAAEPASTRTTLNQFFSQNLPFWQFGRHSVVQTKMLCKWLWGLGLFPYTWQ